MYRLVLTKVLLASSIAIIFAGVALLATHSFLVSAQEEQVEQLKDKIVDRNKKLIELKEEIEEYQEELVEVGKEKQSLEGAIETLDLTRKKVSTEIKVTEGEITNTDLEIRELVVEIKEKELLIERDHEILADTIRRLDELESQSIVETLLKHNNLADFWEDLEELTTFQLAINEELKTLAQLKSGLEAVRSKTENKKKTLDELKDQLADEKYVLDVNRQEKDQLLDQTENKESNYQKLLDEKIRARDQFLAELRTFEAQLDFILNPATIPAAGSGVLLWPFESSHMLKCPSYKSALGNTQCITQYFGNTAFASGGAYNGKGHNGVDFRSPPGTKILSALAGTVVGAGNTDATRGCYSYGKWILVKHNNGLSTLYAHLSHISVTVGQNVATGEIIGYSGNSGYSTGPHLHFTVYASEGVKVQKLGDIPGRPITGCSPATIPVAGLEAYLNPLDYL